VVVSLTALRAANGAACARISPDDEDAGER
jgi:hypothetical protein